MNQTVSQTLVVIWLIVLWLCSLVASKVAIVSALATFCITADAAIWAKIVWIKTDCVDKKSVWIA
ncbi:hypothetical protein B0682_08645 [Moraxella lincolnii]|uniref:Uncharacterized protein n=1 Tax=Lwoffella lincolnii TaxID=90241 RepID=A0A1T0CB77_9GAMM|nr:hypothetical protein B0682_08645 [Moraxella lincolnii]